MQYSGITWKSTALIVRYSQKKECISIVFYCSENLSIVITLEPLVQFRWGFQQNVPLLWYVFRRAIFGAGMGRDDWYYWDVLSSGVNLFLVECSSFYSIQWSFIIKDLLAASWKYISSNIHYRPTLLPTPTSTKQVYLMQHWNERQGSNHSHIIHK